MCRTRAGRVKFAGLRRVVVIYEVPTGSVVYKAVIVVIYPVTMLGQSQPLSAAIEPGRILIVSRSGFIVDDAVAVIVDQIAGTIQHQISVAAIQRRGIFRGCQA